MNITSKCERLFIRNSIINKQSRTDGRELLQGRTLEIVFGKERGCCMVLQGNTRILVQVSCEISEPRASTPTEGVVHVNLNYSAMASPDAKSVSRSSEEFVISQRALDRCIRDSKCIDLESLCIVAGSKVWAIRVNINLLNNDGNITECASIGAISALAHFRRPVVTVVGTDVTVHSIEEKEPEALNLLHMPISINLALFENGKTILVDPNEVEERACDGCYIIGMNAHQEMCFVLRRGMLLLKENICEQCENIATKRAQEVTQIIRAALDDDAYKRTTNAPIGFTHLIQSGTILGAKRPKAEIDLDSIKSLQEPKIMDAPVSSGGSKDLPDSRIVFEGQFRSRAKERAMQILKAAQFEGDDTSSSSEEEEVSQEEITNVKPDVPPITLKDSEEEESSLEEIPIVKPDVPVITLKDSEEEEVSLEEIPIVKPDVPTITLEDSEEETVYVNKDQLDVKTPCSRGWYVKDPFL